MVVANSAAASGRRVRRVSAAAPPLDIAVVGAGPAGLAAALLLDQIGFRVALIAPERTGADERTSALLAGSVALLERIGVWPLLAAEAAPLRSLRIVDGTRRLIRAPEVLFHCGEIGLAAFGYNIPNAALIDALETILAERAIRRITALAEDIASGDDDVVLDLSNGDRLKARLAVAADGRRSKLRDAAGIPVREWRYDQAALVVNLRHALPHDDTSTEFHTEHGPFTLVPLPGNRSSLVWVDRPAEANRRAAASDDELAAEIEKRSAAILGAIVIDGRRQVFPLAGMNAARFAARRVALVGEAAHLFPPIGAQGLNLGYRDVVALGEALSGLADPGAEEPLAAYDRARRGDVLTRSAAVDALNRTLLTGFLPVQGLRGLGLFLLDRVPSLRRAVMRRGVAEA
jgi:2-octaprenyl-6-methoxyphenol hydroxylase